MSRSFVFTLNHDSRVTETELRQVIEKQIGAGKIEEIREKKVIQANETRNILIVFTDLDALKVR